MKEENMFNLWFAELRIYFKFREDKTSELRLYYILQEQVILHAVQLSTNM